MPNSARNTNPIRVKVVSPLPTRWWMHQFPGNVPRWDSCEFIFDPTCREYDWLVVNNEIPSVGGGRSGFGFEELPCPPAHTMLTTTEPSSIKIYGRAYRNQFGCVLTSQGAWAPPHPDRIFLCRPAEMLSEQCPYLGQLRFRFRPRLPRLRLAGGL